MLITRIVCQTDDPSRFAGGQPAWQQLAGLAGFLGQFGGWSIANDREAILLSLWESDAHYQAFLTTQHEGLAAESGQAAALQAGQTACFEQAIAIPGRDTDLGDLVRRWARDGHPEAASLRLVETTVHAVAREGFFHAQRTLWNPALTANGILAGTFGPNVTEPNGFLTVSLWATMADQDAYQRTVLPGLISAADVIGSCRAITGRFATVVPDWTVGPAR